MKPNKLPNTNLESLYKSLERLHAIPAPAVTKEVEDAINTTQQLIDYIEMRLEKVGYL